MKLLGKNRAAVRGHKHAYRKQCEMSWEASEEYLMAKLDQLRLPIPRRAARRACKQFLDKKTYRPGLGGYEKKE